MSAYIVQPDTLAKLSAWAYENYGIDPLPLGETLLRENIRSVCYRYNIPYEDLAVQQFTGLENIAHYLGWLRHDLEETDGKVVNKAMALELINEIDYQSCECPDYEQSQAYRLLTTLKRLWITQQPSQE